MLKFSYCWMGKLFPPPQNTWKYFELPTLKFIGSNFNISYWSKKVRPISILLYSARIVSFFAFSKLKNIILHLTSRAPSLVTPAARWVGQKVKIAMSVSQKKDHPPKLAVKLTFCPKDMKNYFRIWKYV